MLSGRQLYLDDLQRMIGPAEHLLAQIAGFGVAQTGCSAAGSAVPGLPRAAASPQREVERGREPNQDHGGRAHFFAFDLADHRLGYARAFGEIRQRPAAAVAFEPESSGNSWAGSSIKLDIFQL